MMRVVECARCGECAKFDSWPDEGADSLEVLDELIRAELWTESPDGAEICPECSGSGDE